MFKVLKDPLVKRLVLLSSLGNVSFSLWSGALIIDLFLKLSNIFYVGVAQFVLGIIPNILLPYLGYLVDRFPARRVAVVGILLEVLLLLLLSLEMMTLTGSYLLYAVLASVAPLGVAINLVGTLLGKMYRGLINSQEHARQLTSLRDTLRTAVYVVFDSFTGVLVYLKGPSSPFIIAFIIELAGFVFLLTAFRSAWSKWNPATVKDDGALPLGFIRSFLKASSPFAFIFVLTVTLSFLNSANTLLITGILKNFKLFAIYAGLFSSLLYAGLAVGYPLGSVVRLRRGLQLLLLGAAGSSLLLLVVIAHSPLLILAIVFIITLMEGLGSVYGQSIVFYTLPQEMYGRLSSVYQGLISVLTLVGSLLITYLAGLQTPARILFAVALTSAMINLAIISRKRFRNIPLTG